MQLSVRTYYEAPEGREIYSIRVQNNVPFLRDDFLVLLPSRNGMPIEQEVADNSYRNLLMDEEILADENVEEAAMYSGSQASQPEEEETLLDTEEPDMGGEIEEYLTQVYIEHGQEFTEQAENQDYEEALARAIRESTESASASLPSLPRG